MAPQQHPGAEGAVVWQSLQHEWRAKILELNAVQCEHSKGREKTKLITKEQDEGFGFCSEKLKQVTSSYVYLGV